MTQRPTNLLLVAVAILAGGAASVVVACEVAADMADDGRSFQLLVGGVGLGPALDLSRSERDFDPRVGHVSTERFEPVPAGDAFGPHGAPRGRFP